MSHKSRCCDTCGEPEPQSNESCPRCGAPCTKYGASDHKYQYESPKIEKPLSAIAAMAVDLGDPTLSSTFRKRETRIAELEAALDKLLTAIGQFVDEHGFKTYWQYDNAVKQARTVLNTERK